MKEKSLFELLHMEVVKVSDSHGLCYLVEIPQRDYQEKRQIWLDEDEYLLLRDTKIENNA